MIRPRWKPTLTERSNRLKQKAAVADHRDAEFPEVLGGQFRQHPDVDPVVAECCLVLPQSRRDESAIQTIATSF
jgi:hypothetical protein